MDGLCRLVGFVGERLQVCVRVEVIVEGDYFSTIVKREGSFDVEKMGSELCGTDARAAINDGTFMVVCRLLDDD